MSKYIDMKKVSQITEIVSCIWPHRNPHPKDFLGGDCIDLTSQTIITKDVLFFQHFEEYFNHACSVVYQTCVHCLYHHGYTSLSRSSFPSAIRLFVRKFSHNPAITSATTMLFAFLETSLIANTPSCLI